MCLLLCILTSKHMLAHAFAWSKTIKNIQKCVKKVFLIVFDHAKACASMHFLVKIHNNYHFCFYSIYSKAKLFQQFWS